MSQDLVSSAPGIYQALLSLVQTAAAAQKPAPIQVFPFELGQYEPGSYVTLHAIENHTFEWAYIGPFSQYEHYDVVGCATVFTGDTVTSGTVATDVLSQTYSLFQTLVMTPVMSNRNMPIFNTTGPTPYLMLPEYARYSAGPGEIGGNPGGWVGVIEFAYHFDALVTPA